MTEETKQPTSAVRPIQTGYAGEPELPLAGYAALLATFTAGVGAFALALRRSGRSLPERVELGDLVLMGVATHKLSRLIAKDEVTSAFRAPFTQFKEQGAGSEINEEPRGRGLRRAVGKLVACPFCVGMWVASGYAYGLVLQPRATRLAGSVLGALTLSDFLHYAYAAVQRTE